MDGRDLDERPADTTRRRLRSFMTSRGSSGGGDASGSTAHHDDQQHRFSRLHLPVPSIIRRLTTRGSSTTQSRTFEEDGGLQVDETAPQRRRPFSSMGRSENRRFSYIHQETVTTITDRNTAYTPLAQNDDSQEPHELEVPAAVRTPSRLQRHRRLSLSFSNQMSNFFANITPSSRNARSSHSNNLFHPRSRMSHHEPIAELADNDDGLRFDRGFRPPTPAAYRANGSQEHVEGAEESEYERGYTPRRRRHRPRPVVGEPHDEDYIQRRRESDRRARRATWGPSNNPYSLRESSMESLEELGRTPPPPAELPGSTPTRLPSLFGRSSTGVDAELPEPPQFPLMRGAREGGTSTNSPMMFRPAMALRQLLARRTSNRSDNTPPSQIPLTELRRLLESYAAQSNDRDYNGHQETTVDGGTITIYGIRRVNARQARDEDDTGLFPPPSPSDAHSEERPPLSRDRPRGPRRIFNFIGPGLNEIDPLPPEFEETFERLRRTRRPRSMFGSGSLRRNGVVEPDVPNASTNNESENGGDARPSTEGNPENNGSGSNREDSDETWIFYIVSAVLPEGHPLLSAPSLFTDNPTYEDMLFLDSFLQKPVATRGDLDRARGLYSIHRRSNGDLYASGREEVEDEIQIGVEERCLICLGDFSEGEEGRRLKACEHFFHRECIDTWLTEGRNSCPLCRGEGVAKKRSERHATAGPSSAAAQATRRSSSDL